MQKSALEEAALTQHANEPETPEPQPDIEEQTSTPEPEVGAPETQEREGTALAPTEPEVVDGEVIELEPPEPLDACQPSKQKPYWLLIPFAIVLCLLFLAGLYLLPLLTPSATVLIIPVEKNISLTTAIKVQGRLLPTLTLSQSQTTPATGKRHQDATQAQGTITFYNGLLSSQTIAAGTILTGADGVEIITDQAARIPPASNTTPPTFGQVTVAAHAVQPGVNGNIPPYDINGSCCGASILAKNTAAFTGGADARDYTVVTRVDINIAVTSLLVTLSQSENAALQVQLHPGEALIPASCSPHVSTNHKLGEEAKQVSVSVSETCEGIAYAAHEVDQEATQMETTASANRFGTGYIPLRDTHLTITHATITNQAQGTVALTVKIDATVVYQLTPREKEQIRNLIAGKTKQQAQALLLQLPGIAGAAITITGHAVFTASDTATLPDNPKAITIVIAERL
jgi:hypothetical protein